MFKVSRKISGDGGEEKMVQYLSLPCFLEDKACVDLDQLVMRLEDWKADTVDFIKKEYKISEANESEIALLDECDRLSHSRKMEDREMLKELRNKVKETCEF